VKVLGELTDEEELLLRQVNPGFIRAGRPSSKVFEPKPRDEGMLSIGIERRRAAQDAYEFFVKIPKCRSVGIIAVTVGDCLNEALPAHYAPLVHADGDPLDDDAHGIIDFRRTSVELYEEKAIALHRAAMARGYVYQPPIASSSG
jgi:hypothetical protein